MKNQVNDKNEIKIGIFINVKKEIFILFFWVYYWKSNSYIYFIVVYNNFVELQVKLLFKVIK